MKKSLSISLSIFILLILIFSFFYLSRVYYYNLAGKYIESGETYTAITVFRKAGKYKNSEEMVYTLFSKITPKKTVDIGKGHTVAIQNDGTIIATGGNSYGQCDVKTWDNIVDICAGESHTVGLDTNGRPISVGDNSFGQCDVYSWKNIVSVDAGKYFTVGLTSDGKVVATGNNSQNQCNTSEWNDIIAISAGDDRTVGLKSDGRVVCTDQAFDTLNNVKAISAGGDAIFFLLNDGSVIGTGDIESSSAWQTYYEDNKVWVKCLGIDDFCKISAGGMCNIFLTERGFPIILEGGFAKEQKVSGINIVNKWKNIVAVSAGNGHYIGLHPDGTLESTGYDHTQGNVPSWDNIKIP